MIPITEAVEMLSTPVMDPVNWPIIEMNHQIRPLLRERILRFISISGRYLNHQIASRALAPIVLMGTNSLSQSSFDEYEDSDSDSPSRKALIYARVSSHGQTSDDDDSDDEDSDGDDSDTDEAEDDDDSDSSNDEDDEGSIEGQIDELTELAKDKDLQLAHEPIVDKAQTGTNFDRDGIQKVFRLAQRDEVGYLLVEKVDRIGRSAAETLYFIYILQTECDVTLLTPTGEHDLDQVRGLLHTTLMSLMAQIKNEIRTAKATKERVRKFVEKQIWEAYSRIIPLGYSETDDGWLEPDPDEQDAAEDLFAVFTNPDSDGYRSYAGTEREINERYDGILDGHTVKTLLQNPVYIGRPQIPEDWVVDLPYDNVVEDDDLQLVDEDTFEEAQRIIEEKDRKHSTDEDTKTLVDFVEEFDLFSVIAASDPATLLHDCGEPMVFNGQRDLDGNLQTHLYHCPKCNEDRKWPREYEEERMKVIHLLLDDEVGFLEAVQAAVSIARE